MKRSLAGIVAAPVVAGARVRVSAQETTGGPGMVEVTVMPGGATFFPITNDMADFGNGDYRFFALHGKDDAQSFLGPSDRYAHRVCAGLIINAIR